MAEYPSSPVPQFPYSITENWKTIVSTFDSGEEQRRRKRIFPLYDVDLVYHALTETDINTLWDFYRARAGAYEAFYWYTPSTASWEGLGVGTGDGTTTTFDLPGKDTNSQDIYVDEVEEADEDYTISVGTGNESADQVIFDTAPAANEIITCDFAGYMRVRARFAEDKMSKINFLTAIFQTGLSLKGLPL